MCSLVGGDIVELGVIKERFERGSRSASPRDAKLHRPSTLRPGDPPN